MPTGIFPFRSDGDEWPPDWPAHLDEFATPYRCVGYRWVYSAKQAEELLLDGIPMNAAFRLTKEWIDPPNGYLRMPAPDEPVLGLHAAAIIRVDPKTHRFTLINSWGQGWGDKGFATIPFEYFDAYTTEVISSMGYRVNYRFPGERLTKLENSALSTKHSKHNVYVFTNKGDTIRYAWAMLSEEKHTIDVHDLFVRPEYRGRGYGTLLMKAAIRQAKRKKKKLQVFIGCPDVGTDNLKAIKALIQPLSLHLWQTGYSWAPLRAENRKNPSEIEPIHLGDPPALPFKDLIAKTTIAAASLVNPNPASAPDGPATVWVADSGNQVGDAKITDQGPNEIPAALTKAMASEQGDKLKAYLTLETIKTEANILSVRAEQAGNAQSVSNTMSSHQSPNPKLAGSLTALAGVLAIWALLVVLLFP